MIYLLENFENFIDNLNNRGLLSIKEKQYIKVLIEQYKQEELEGE